MRVAKTRFEQVPLETVKKIAAELNDRDSIENFATVQPQTELAPQPERWRQVAEQVQQERDPARMIELVQKLIATFDNEELEKRAKR